MPTPLDYMRRVGTRSLVVFAVIMLVASVSVWAGMHQSWRASRPADP